MAAVLGQMLSSGHLVVYLDELKYFDTMSFIAKEIIMKPTGELKEGENGEMYSDQATISLTIMINTENAQKHMAKEMDVPLFLLNLIMPKKLYVTCTYDVTITEEGEYNVANATLGINGRSPKQSAILLNILISFIFPPEENMTPEKLSETFGGVVNSGLKILGSVEFYSKDTALGKENGIFVKINSHLDVPEQQPETPPVAESV